ncbi:HNH endonuclease [Embleya sp. NPDC005971]|uniref:HNH endonuclease n=1 Tax=Embleya sp. NPDC005971 TaxID=3156724 RepID=UPI0033EF6F60
MPRRLRPPCSRPGCGNTKPCPDHANQADRQRGSAAARGYDGTWADTRADYLAARPWCCLCGAAATVADHWPTSRRDLVAASIRDPDADHRLRPLCRRCHSTETATAQPGGWNAERESPPF